MAAEEPESSERYWITAASAVKRQVSFRTLGLQKHTECKRFQIIVSLGSGSVAHWTNLDSYDGENLLRLWLIRLFGGLNSLLAIRLIENIPFCFFLPDLVS